jgi:hypothetical protein
MIVLNWFLNHLSYFILGLVAVGVPITIGAAVLSQKTYLKPARRVFLITFAALWVLGFSARYSLIYLLWSNFEQIPLEELASLELKSDAWEHSLDADKAKMVHCMISEARKIRPHHTSPQEYIRLIFNTDQGKQYRYAVARDSEAQGEFWFKDHTLPDSERVTRQFSSPELSEYLEELIDENRITATSTSPVSKAGV